jgi:hypothetical protein
MLVHFHEYWNKEEFNVYHKHKDYHDQGFSQCTLELRQIYVKITQQIIRNKAMKHAKTIIFFLYSKHETIGTCETKETWLKNRKKLYFKCTLDCDVE